ncbi:MAG: hypothetical protein F4107_12200 [Gemmatimonadetes bacterium]|nr:hypothetical protein [Gemmatimonadota bacterium]MYD13033.1 hypothetical protein [Gemmatimonadota bacterium]MYI66675.1 hypothetical protein [Gemmatimonadota bacterium]
MVVGRSDHFRIRSGSSLTFLLIEGLDITVTPKEGENQRSSFASTVSLHADLQIGDSGIQPP